jgi:hypothetical protein
VPNRFLHADGMDQWFPEWAVQNPGGLKGKDAAGGDGGGPFRARCSFIYDLSDSKHDIRKMVSLHQAHPLQ